MFDLFIKKIMYHQNFNFFKTYFEFALIKYELVYFNYQSLFFLDLFNLFEKIKVIFEHFKFIKLLVIRY